MSAVCNGQPLSWLRLERYHLGELDAGERRDIGEHLALCPACRACLERITGDRRELPPLPLPLTRSGPAGVRAWSVQPARVPLLSWPRRLAWASGLAGGALAAAALALLLLLPPPDG
ncbi:MAG: hypothetical protein FJ125_16460, partial [Deltaproteobacteria bacterium]|nr:hypothetical protein [Deltaproteobacteria bacterium]